MPDYEGMILERAEIFDECGFCEYWSYCSDTGLCYYDGEHEEVI